MSEEEIRELKSKITSGGALEYLKSIKKDGKDIHDLIREILENSTLSGEYKADLLLQTEDFEFCKSILCTGGAKEYKIDLNSFFGGAIILFENQDNSSLAKEILEKNDVGYMKIGKILDVIEDKEYLEKIIREGKYEFESNALMESIKKIGNPQLAEYVLKNNEKYGLPESHIIVLLQSPKLVELSKEVVLNADKLGLDSQTIVKFAKMSNDKRVIKEVLNKYSEKFKNENILELLTTVEEPTFVSDWINSNDIKFDKREAEILIQKYGFDKLAEGIINNLDKFPNSKDLIVEGFLNTKNDEILKDIINLIDIVDYDDQLKLLGKCSNKEEMAEHLLNTNFYDENQEVAIIEESGSQKLADEYFKSFFDGKRALFPYRLISLMSPSNYKKMLKKRKEYDISLDSILNSKYDDKVVIEILNDDELNLTDKELKSLFVHSSIEVKKEMLFKESNENFTTYFNLLKKQIDVAKELLSVEEIREKVINSDIVLEWINFLDWNEQRRILSNLEQDEVKNIRCYSLDYEVIEKNLEIFIEKEQIDSYQVDNIVELKNSNNEILRCNWDILKEKYVKIFGKDKINIISCFPGITENILNLNEFQLKVVKYGLDKYINENNNGEEYTSYLSRILDQLQSYTELINDVEKNGDISDIERVVSCLEFPINLGIENTEELENFEEIKEKALDKLINSESVIDKKTAVSLKVFGVKDISSLIELYGNGVDEIYDENIKAYMQCLKQIDEIYDPEILEEIYCSGAHVEEGNSILMETKIKDEYRKLYNEGLLKLEDAELINEQEGMYEAGTDFKMIITMIGAYVKNDSENVKEDWNRPSIGVQHFCASYIRNDMLGTAGNTGVCYGFVDMNKDSLIHSGSSDLVSTTYGKFNTSVNDLILPEEFLTPENQVNNTVMYNEMDFRRIQGGKKKQPDYLVAFREHGEIQNLEKVLKAQEDWSTDDKKFPIVIVDVDKCLEEEKKKIGIMVEKFLKTKDEKLAMEIITKYYNSFQKDEVHFLSDEIYKDILVVAKEAKKKLFSKQKLKFEALIEQALETNDEKLLQDIKYRTSRTKVSNTTITKRQICSYWDAIGGDRCEGLAKEINEANEKVMSKRKNEEIKNNDTNKEEIIPLEEQDITREDLEEIDAEVKPNEREACSCVILLDEIKKIKKRQGEKVYGR